MRIDALTIPGVAAQKPAGDAAPERVAVALPAAAVAEVAQLQEVVEAPMDMEQAVRQIESFLKSVGRTLEFRVDANTHRTVITVRNTTNGEVIRQIPNEEVLQLARFLGQGAAGALKVKV
jgi:flagellar protein FlaG